jgi:hypothetical protein
MIYYNLYKFALPIGKSRLTLLFFRIPGFPFPRVNIPCGSVPPIHNSAVPLAIETRRKPLELLTRVCTHLSSE